MVEAKTKYLLLLVVGGFIFLFNLGGRDLWEPDETRYAVVAREISNRSDSDGFSDGIDIPRD